MDAAGPPPEGSAVADVIVSGAPDGGAGARTSSLLGLPPAVAAAVAASLVVLLVLAAAAAAAFFARRRGARPSSLSRVEHAPSSGSSHPASSSARKEKVVVDAEAVASSSDVASSSAAASSLESPARRKAEIRVGGAAAGVEMGWGRWYELAELEAATGGFCAENVVGEGGYGTVYRGVLAGGEVVAVKDLFDHKMLVYEFVENGNLEQWLHGDVGPVSPLTWEIRMKIAVGTAKGRRVEDLVDPRIAAAPPARVLNRALLVCLRCIDSDAHKRPKMGQIVHMLEGDEFPFRMEHRSPRASHRTSTGTRPSLLSENVGAEDSDKSMWR
ncbi:hypothetical protein EJB05_07444 [Eragrostis curvula]|uniref:Protein kinase domain-containing protein n=1 Tax=Eragrostis curvula TaxID=38414 RepID=A0A5J9WIE6_9POAL|nr:hypothetical protein EJB05_07444 [Eragrostis curvula]